MSKFIKHRQIASDTWQVLASDAASVPQQGQWIVPLRLWREHRDQLSHKREDIGVLLGPGDDPAELAADLERIPLIAVNFPSFTEGRGFSTARLLRERYGFKGELRAVGDIFQDQLFSLARCGFDAFALRSDQDVEAALAALDEFPEVYQAAADRGPLFSRRFA
jgi:uncharacterized protein (DUF934 family)